LYVNGNISYWSDDQWQWEKYYWYCYYSDWHSAYSLFSNKYSIYYSNEKKSIDTNDQYCELLLLNDYYYIPMTHIEKLLLMKYILRNEMKEMRETIWEK